MRVIKFRGKRVDTDEWVYGYYVNQYGDHSIYLPDSADGIFDAYHVAPETVGQFTGLTDKNGVEIYEGDIVKTGFTCEKYKVYYNESEVVFVGSPLASNTETEFWLDSTFEVIGNIHNNKKLIK